MVPLHWVTPCAISGDCTPMLVRIRHSFPSIPFSLLSYPISQIISLALFLTSTFAKEATSPAMKTVSSEAIVSSATWADGSSFK